MTKPLNPYVASVTIEAETLENAEQVLAERLGYDEDYGFDYRLSYGEVQDAETVPGIVIDASIIRDILEWKMETVDEYDERDKRLIRTHIYVSSMSDDDLNNLIASTDDRSVWELFHEMCDRILDHVVDATVGPDLS